jgi:hypothetical protein
VGLIYIILRMDKQKKALSKEIDAGIVACALGEARDEGCDEAELVRLAIEYANQFRCPYQLSAAHMRSLETDAERGVARRLEANVNNVIRTTMRSVVPGLTGLSRIVVEKFTDQPKPFPRPLVRICNCTASRRSPKCKVPVEFCKHTALHLAKLVPRKKSKEPPKPKAASPKPKAASPKTRKSHGGRKYGTSRRK